MVITSIYIQKFSMLFNVILYMAFLTFLVLRIADDQSFVDKACVWRKCKVSILVSIIFIYTRLGVFMFFYLICDIVIQKIDNITYLEFIGLQCHFVFVIFFFAFTIYFLVVVFFIIINKKE